MYRRGIVIFMNEWMPCFGVSVCGAHVFDIALGERMSEELTKKVGGLWVVKVFTSFVVFGIIVWEKLGKGVVEAAMLGSEVVLGTVVSYAWTLTLGNLW
jgi:hypothetical protein